MQGGSFAPFVVATSSWMQNENVDGGKNGKAIAGIQDHNTGIKQRCSKNCTIHVFMQTTRDKHPSGSKKKRRKTTPKERIRRRQEQQQQLFLHYFYSNRRRCRPFHLISRYYYWFQPKLCLARSSAASFCREVSRSRMALMVASNFNNVVVISVQ